VTQQSLTAYFEQFGRVTQMQLIYDSAGKFKGFGFVTFADQAVAEEVCQKKDHEFEGRPIDCRRPIGSSGPAEDDANRVFVGGLPKTSTKDNVTQYFEEKFGKTTSVQLRFDSGGKFRGFAFVTFEDKGVADLACATKGQYFQGKAIDCRHADPDAVDDSQDKVFVGGLPRTAKPAEVEEFFSQFGKVACVDMKYDENDRFRGFCFVTFEDKNSAEAVYRNHEENRFQGRWIDCRPAVRKPAIQTAMNGLMDSLMNSTLPTAAILGISGALNPAAAGALSSGLDPARALVETPETTNPAPAAPGAASAAAAAAALQSNGLDPNALWTQYAALGGGGSPNMMQLTGAGGSPSGNLSLLSLAGMADGQAAAGPPGNGSGGLPDVEAAAALLGQYGAMAGGMDSNAAMLMLQQYKAMAGAGGSSGSAEAFGAARSANGSARPAPYAGNKAVSQDLSRGLAP